MTLPQIEQIADYAGEAELRPISQYQGKPRLLAWILSYVNRCQELENAAWDVILKRMIDNAEAAQLDTIGKIVGQLRNRQTDGTYRIYITARIRVNRSLGHADDAIDVLRLIEAALFTYTEFYPGVAIVEYLTSPTADPRILSDIAQQAVSAGVRLFLITTEDEDDAFLLGDDTIGGEIDADHGLSDEAGLTGGSLAAIW